MNIHSTYRYYFKITSLEATSTLWRFSINKYYVMKQTFLKIRTNFCILFHKKIPFVPESMERSLIIYCLKQPNYRKDLQKTCLLWHFHSQERNNLAVRILSLVLFLWFKTSFKA